jgi:hypothetical protein
MVLVETVHKALDMNIFLILILGEMYYQTIKLLLLMLIRLSHVSYWANNQWNVGEVHSLNGTQTNPDAVDRDGTNGFGVDGTNISGAAANLASGANLWKFEGTQPFSVIINDTADDEERLLGWMSNKTLRTSSNVTQSFVNLIDKDDRSRMKIYGKDLTTTVEYAGAKLSGADYIEFDGVDDYV